MKNFIAKYSQNGVEKVVSFDASRFDKDRAEKLLAANGIQNFFFFFEPFEFTDMPDGSLMVSGEVGFVPGRRRLVTGHTNEDRDDPYRVDQGKQTNKKFKIRWKIKERLDHVLLRLCTCPGLTLCHEKSR